MNKITIVGAGRVGEAAAHCLAIHESCAEVVLLDIAKGVPQGAALDIQESASVLGFDTTLRGSNEPADMAHSELIVITAGVPRKPGMSRSDVLDTNLKVTSSIMEDVQRRAPDAMVIMVTNPVDILTYAAWKHSGWSRDRVFGMAGVLDSARMASFVAMETGLSTKDINAMVLGGHGDSMVPMTRFTTINGISVEHFLNAEQLAAIIKRTRNGGAEVLALKKNSSAYEAPGAAIAAMADAISHDRKRLLPCVAALEGEYGERDICMGVPAVLGAGGLERVVELPLNNEEQGMFATTIKAIRKDLAQLDL